MRLSGVFLLSVSMLSQIIPAMAKDEMKLFKIVGAKDEVVIGLTAAEAAKPGAGPDLDNLARHLAANGQMTVWQYAVRKDPKGELQQAPLRRIAIFRQDTARIEPYATPLPVIAPDQ